VISERLREFFEARSKSCFRLPKSFGDCRVWLCMCEAVSALCRSCVSVRLRSSFPRIFAQFRSNARIFSTVQLQQFECSPFSVKYSISAQCSVCSKKTDWLKFARIGESGGGVEKKATTFV